MIKLKIDTSQTKNFISNSELEKILPLMHKSFENLIYKKGKGNDFLGWVDLPSEISENNLNELISDAQLLRKKSEIVVVIGIGGSYLGTRAVIDALNDPFSSMKNNDALQIVYAGNSLSASYHAQLLELLDKKAYSVIVISKSGTTTEPAVAFRLIKNHCERKYGKKEASSRIIAVTDKSRGALKTLALKEGYKTYVIPDNVGGRFSVLTPVGLLPIAVAGYDIRKLVSGANNMRKYLHEHTDISNNPALLYAATRNILLQKGKSIEILVNYQPSLYFFTEWWKQLYGESEGKDNKGIFTAGVNFTTDLHSLGQYIQDGQRLIFETVLSVEEAKHKLEIPVDAEDSDGLNFIAGKNLDEVNTVAETGTSLAHVDGGVPNIRITIPLISEEYLGELIYFYEFACGLSGYVLDVNPFDQPGVEAYKNNMFALLRKPGYEKQSEEIYNRLK